MKIANKEVEQSAATGKLKCPECGETKSKYGRPFTAISLRMHHTRAHPGVEWPEPPGAVRCDICGKARDQKGRPFKNEESVVRHKRMAHRAGAKPAVKPPGNGRVRLAGQQTRTVAKFCPDCGCNLEVVNAALTLAGGGVA